MSDGWELAHGLIPGILDGEDDSDGDGLTNLQEFLAGTHPYDPGDRLKLNAQTIVQGSTRAVLLTFQMKSNKTYSVVYAHGLNASNWTNLVHWNARPTNATVNFVDQLPTNAISRYYRLAAPRQP
jgi:hypothetical protein